MLHHIGIEVAPEDIPRAAELFELLGFERVQPPPTLAEFTWLERDRTQVHLMPEPNPVSPPRGHLAVVVPDFEAVLAALRGAGFELEPAREHWGAARARVLAPGGHRVELMSAPPTSPRS
jgi:catechol 2,3-dioxygenase-like lactoylglutathione lyase family enzyme